MNKNPLQFEEEDFNALMNKSIRIHICQSTNENDIKILDGKIIKIFVAANPPHLPESIDFQLLGSHIINIKYYQLKHIASL